jgi:hypothetical protein
MAVVRRRILILLIVLVIGGIAVVGWYSLPAPPPKAVSAPDRQPQQIGRRPPVPMQPGELERLQSVGRRLATVQVGMRRADVEAAIGRPDPKTIGPVERSADGQPTYRTRYPAFVSEALWFAPDLRGFCEAVLEYDASRPGHPLVRLSATATPAPLPPAGGVITPPMPM